MTKMYDLMPCDGHKSFYGKAKVEVKDDRTEILYSYGTPIIRRNPDGTLKRLWFDWSATTGRHIASFFGLSKKQFEALQ